MSYQVDKLTKQLDKAIQDRDYQKVEDTKTLLQLAKDK